jgi:hypothetical protein
VAAVLIAVPGVAGVALAAGGGTSSPEPERLETALKSDAPDRFLRGMNIDPAKGRKVGQARRGTASYFHVTTPEGLSCVITDRASGTCATPEAIAAGRGWGAEICPPDATQPTMRIRGQVPPGVTEVTLTRESGDRIAIPAADGFFMAELDLPSAQRDAPATLAWATTSVAMPLPPDLGSIRCP